MSEFGYYDENNSREPSPHRPIDLRQFLTVSSRSVDRYLKMAGVVYYTVAGRQVGSHYIAMGWLATLFGGGYYALSGPKNSAAKATPPINASSSDEADFIKKFMEEQEKK
ncbi:hypothetical protein G6O67_005428 [Ophiocordyceps sinensis]|uniref:Uncharacterized protein n=1 Tax=Ophiocordyceps sinensis TaxID=72228 RepID=A0A8H4PRJ9_9HYPO|nr:hypothetical protein G6O67_005428 [Ophiocordyceps sinensis]